MVLAKASSLDAAGQCHKQMSLPTNVSVRIVSGVSNRALYAAKGKNWGSGVGAGGPSDAVGADGFWLVTSEGPYYRIVNQYSSRSLYADTADSSGQNVGAGFPSSDVHSDGLWNIIRLDTGLYAIIDSLGRSLYANKDANWGRGFGVLKPRIDAWSIVAVD